jgi:chromate reductase
MPHVGIIVGSLHSKSINRELAHALIALAPEGSELEIIDISQLPMYSPDHDADYPAAAREFKQHVESVDGVIIVTPEYLRSIPGVLKNALEWASRPWGTNSFNGKPVAIAGASVGAIGTAAAQQGLRANLGHLNAPTLGQPEVFLRFSPEVFPGNGEVTDDAVSGLLQNFLTAAIDHIERYAPVAAR